MTDLITLSLIAVVLAWCADHILLRPIEPVPEEGVRHRQIFLTVVIIILLAGFAGLRTRCNDTGAYKHGYELLNTDGYLESLNKSIGSNPLFNLINYFLKLNNVSTQNFLMFWAFLTVGCYVAFCHRFAESYALSVFLLLWGVHFLWRKTRSRNPSPIAMIALSAALGIVLWSF